MSNIIDDLYLGNINPNEFTHIVHRGYRHLLGEAVACEEWLAKHLKGDSQSRFSAFVDKNEAMNSIEVRLRFIEGFRLGAQIMLDVLTCPELKGGEAGDGFEI